jgi:uncharacterized RDD family membrane protein YckC
MTERVEQRDMAVAAGGRAAVARKPEARFERLRAPFSLRCGALLIDYTVPVSVLAFSTLLARSLGGNTRWWGIGLLTLGYFAAAGVALVNFIVLPVFTGRTVGKWVTDLRIERTNGEPLSYARSILRHIVGYALTVATLGLGFLVAALNSSGRSLHDFVAGTVVVRNRSVARSKRTR